MRLRLRGSLRRYRWWITLAALCLWTFAAHYEAAGSDRAYAECEAHPAPGVFCVDSGAAVVWVIWAIPLIVMAFVLIVVLVRRTLSSAGDAVDRDPE